jgi:hypothetical protein
MKHQPRKCAYCEQEFIPARRNRKFCSDTCKQYNYLTKKTEKKYGVDKVQLIERANIKTEPLVITEQMAATPSIESTAPSIAITYEFMGKSLQVHPPKGIIFGRWYSTFAG